MRHSLKRRDAAVGPGAYGNRSLGWYRVEEGIHLLFKLAELSRLQTVLSAATRQKLVWSAASGSGSGGNEGNDL